MKNLIAVVAALLLAACAHQPKKIAPPPAPPPPTIATVELAPVERPMVDLRVVFHTGSIDDPPGKEGLTALCFELMTQGGTRSLDAAALQEALFPLAAELGGQVDKEETVFTGRVHKDFISRFEPIFAEVITAPRLDEQEFERLKRDAIDHIVHTLRTGDDEALSRQALLNFMFAGHPYAHDVGGSVSGLEAITLADVKAQIARVFTVDRLTLGIAGGYAPPLVAKLQKDLGVLPRKGAPIVALPAAPTQIRARLVEKDTDSTAMFLGYAWDVKRGSPDYFALAVGISALGEHRQFGGRLFEALRDQRGLNYGDYAYVEHFIQDGWGTYPLTNIGLRQQYFSLWIRAVEPRNRGFALRAAIHVARKTAEEGITQAELDQAKGFLATYTRLWELTEDRRLGYALDDAFYGTPHFLESYRQALGSLTLEQVNAALKKHLDPSRLHLAVVTRGAQAFADALVANTPSPMRYDKGRAPKDKKLLAEDKVIQSIDLGLKATDLQLMKADELFQ